MGILFPKDFSSWVRTLLCMPKKKRIIPGIEGKCCTVAMDRMIIFLTDFWFCKEHQAFRKSLVFDELQNKKLSGVE